MQRNDFYQKHTFHTPLLQVSRLKEQTELLESRFFGIGIFGWMHWIRWYANTKIQKYKYTITGLLEWKPLEALDPSSPPLPFSTSSASSPLPRTGSGTTWRGSNQPGLDSVSSARVGSVQETTTSTNNNKQTNRNWRESNQPGLGSVPSAKQDLVLCE